MCHPEIKKDGIFFSFCCNKSKRILVCTSRDVYLNKVKQSDKYGIMNVKTLSIVLAISFFSSLDVNAQNKQMEKMGQNEDVEYVFVDKKQIEEMESKGRLNLDIDKVTHVLNLEGDESFFDSLGQINYMQALKAPKEKYDQAVRKLADKLSKNYDVILDMGDKDMKMKMYERESKGVVIYVIFDGDVGLAYISGTFSVSKLMKQILDYTKDKQNIK